MKQDPGNIDPKNLFRILGCPGGLRGFGNDHARIALHLGLDSQTPMKEIVDFLVANRNPKNLSHQYLFLMKNRHIKAPFDS